MSYATDHLATTLADLIQRIASGQKTIEVKPIYSTFEGGFTIGVKDGS